MYKKKHGLTDLKKEGVSASVDSVTIRLLNFNHAIIASPSTQQETPQSFPHP
jgi:hypothetical protein